MNEKDFEINYWRTKTGLEVDFILDSGAIAIEVTISDNVDKQDLRGLSAFCEEHKPKASYIVSTVRRARRINSEHGIIDILPVETFLQRLWNHEIV